MKVCGTLLDAVGGTPLVRLNRVTKDVSTEILVKIEYMNPSGSLKDRILRRIIEEAEKQGELRPGMMLIEGTTGNTGISTAMAGAIKGYEVIICMPKGMSEERKKIIKAYGAQIIETPGAESDVDLVLKKVEEIKASAPGKYFEVGQFVNPDNWKAHFFTTGPEIWEQTGGNLDVFIVAQGTGGTFTGVARFLREQKSPALLYVIEPAKCPILSKRQWGSHSIEGIGDGFIPRNLDVSLLSGVVLVECSESVKMAKRLAREEGMFCGISSGCNVVGALKLARKYPHLKRIVTLINDNGLRYFSTELCDVKKEIQIPKRDFVLDEVTKAELDRFQASWDIIVE
jgi:cysteine synthase A